jgi:hypothetical protein
MLSPKRIAFEREQQLSGSKRPKDAWAIIAAALLAGFCLLASLYIAGRRIVWYDEIYTALISGRQWPGEVLRLLKAGVDQQPLPYYLLVKASGKLFGWSAFSLRLPSALGMSAGLLVIFDCVRRLTDGLHGLVALSLLICTVLPFYGFEARPYALVFMWSACSLWLWLHTRRDSKGAALAFGAAVFGSVTAHYYAVFCLIPYAAAALLEIREKGLPPKLIAGCAGAAAGLTLMLPLAGALHGTSADFWAPATLSGLDEVFGDLFPHFLVLSALIVIWMTLAGAFGRKGAPAPPMEASERLAWLFLLIPFAGFAAAKLVTNAFYHRYFIGMLAGVAVGFPCMMWRRYRHLKAASAGVLCVLAGSGILLYLSRMRHAELAAVLLAGDDAVKIEKLLQSEDMLFREGKQYTVVSLDSRLILEAVYLSSHPERYRALDDPRLPIHTQVEMNKVMSSYLPMRIWSVNDLKEHASEAAVADASDAALQSLEQTGLAFQTRLVKPLKVMYLK